LKLQPGTQFLSEEIRQFAMFQLSNFYLALSSFKKRRKNILGREGTLTRNGMISAVICESLQCSFRKVNLKLFFCNVQRDMQRKYEVGIICNIKIYLFFTMFSKMPTVTKPSPTKVFLLIFLVG
jgi:hypothetical protein